MVDQGEQLPKSEKTVYLPRVDESTPPPKGTTKLGGLEEEIKRLERRIEGGEIIKGTRIG